MADEAALRRRLAQAKRDREADARRKARLLKEAEAKAVKPSAPAKPSGNAFQRAGQAVTDAAAAAFGFGTGKAGITPARKVIEKAGEK